MAARIVPGADKRLVIVVIPGALSSAVRFPLPMDGPRRGRPPAVRVAPGAVETSFGARVAALHALIDLAPGIGRRSPGRRRIGRRSWRRSCFRGRSGGGAGA